MTISEWVRHALEAARRRELVGDIGKKLEVVPAATRHDFPSGDIGKILDEVERD